MYDSESPNVNKARQPFLLYLKLGMHLWCLIYSSLTLAERAAIDKPSLYFKTIIFSDLPFIGQYLHIASILFDCLNQC